MSNNNASTQQGSVRMKGNQWYFRFRITEEDGTTRLREFKGGKNKKETEHMLMQALEDYRTKGFVIDAGDATVNDLAEMWYHDEIEYTALSTNGRNDYKNVIRHIREHPLGSMKLRNVTCEHLQAYIDEKYFGEFDENGKQLKHTYSDSHMKKQFRVLSGMFKYAVVPKHLLRDNLMQYVRKRKKPKPVRLFGEEEDGKVHTISNEEYKKIIAHLTGSEQNACFALPVQIAYHTGLRAGEVCGLAWEDIDLEGRSLTVRRSLYYDTENKCWELKVPKNGKSRVVAFGDTLAGILRAAKKKQLEDKMAYGPLYQKHYYQINEIRGRQHCQIFTELDPEIKVLSSRCTKGKFIEDAEKDQPLQPLHLVLSKPGGEMLTTQSLKWLNKLIQKELPEIKDFHFHCLRHTYATTLIANGANFKDVQALMGHSDISITLNIYSHVNPETQRKAVDIFERAVN